MNNLIEKMTAETLAYQDNPEQNSEFKLVEEISEKVENQKQDLVQFLDKNQIATFEGRYNPELKAIRIMIAGQIVDFPKNLTPFDRIVEAVSDFGSLDPILLDGNCDELDLIQALRGIWNGLEVLLIFHVSDVCYMAFFRNSEKNVLQKAIKSFDKLFEIPENRFGDVA